MFTILSRSSGKRHPAMRHYPSPDSLGALIQGSSRASLDSVLLPLGSAPTVIPRLSSSVSRFLALHEELAGSVPKDAPKRSFRGVPSGRHLTELSWYDPDADAYVGAHHPPGHRRPASTTLLRKVAGGDSVGAVVTQLGYPVPEQRPAVMIGGAERPEGLTLVYAPGPHGLAELIYRIVKTSGERYVAVTAERPPEPRFEELVDCYRQAFTSDQSLVYADREALGADRPRLATLERETPAVFQQLG